MNLYKLLTSTTGLLSILILTIQAQTVKDIDGNSYGLVTIGSQTWLKENLKVQHYNNGDLIKTTPSDSTNIFFENEPKYQWACNANNASSANYGRFYTWYVINDSRNICPAGWHVPTMEEWHQLVAYLGGRTVAVGKLKEMGNTHWNLPDSSATNETGFTALPAGEHNYNGENNYQGYICSWWSTTKEDIQTGENSMIFRLVTGNPGISLKGYKEESKGLPVRCIRD